MNKNTNFFDYAWSKLSKCFPKSKSLSEKSDQNLRKSFSNYITCRRIGRGGFGKIYEAENVQTRKKMALKIQPEESEQLNVEIEIYMQLQKKVPESFPEISGWGSKRGKNFLIMELLQKNIGQLFQHHKKKFSVQTTLKIGLHVLSCLKQLHKIGYIHGDVKPQNIMLKNDTKITLIDYGLAEKYLHQKEHRKYRQGRKITGSIKYISIRNQKGCEQSRRDDIESLGYVLLYLINGKLPWQQITGKEKYKQIMTRKESSSLSELCSKIPNLEDFIKYARNLSFEEKPNYSDLQKLLKQSSTPQKLEKHKFQWQKK